MTMELSPFDVGPTLVGLRCVFPGFPSPPPFRLFVLTFRNPTGGRRKFDAGLLMGQSPVLSIDPDATYTSLKAGLADAGATLLGGALDDLPAAFRGALPQARAGLTTAGKVAPATRTIDDWSTVDASQAYNLWRAFDDHGGINTSFDGKVIKLTETAGVVADGCVAPGADPTPAQLAPGALTFDRAGKRLLVRTGGGGWLVVTRLTVEGKAARSAVEFVNGYRLRKLAPGTARFGSGDP